MGTPGLITGIIIQARMGSTRLPGKVLRDVAGKLLLARVTEKLPEPFIIATSDMPQDNIIAAWCAQNRTPCFRGSEADVLSRYYHCAKENHFSHIVRLTADNPFTDREELQNLIRFHINGGYDYSHSFEQMPLGVGAEIFTFTALERSYNEGHASNHREHVNEYIQENPALFSIGKYLVPADKIAPNIRLTVDTQEDLERACWLVAQGVTNTQQAIALCSHSA